MRIWQVKIFTDDGATVFWYNLKKDAESDYLALEEELRKYATLRSYSIGGRKKDIVQWLNLNVTTDNG